MECWSIGVLEYWELPTLQHSNTPTLQHSNTPNKHSLRLRVFAVKFRPCYYNRENQDYPLPGATPLLEELRDEFE